MKADGCVEAGGKISMTTVSIDIAHGMQRLFLKLGKLASITKTIRPRTCVIEGRTVRQRDTYKIQVYPGKSRHTTFIDGSHAWFAPFKMSQSTSEQVPVYNFEVDTDNSYIVENTIVHNCQPFSSAGHKGAMLDARGTLFHDIARIVEHHRPRILLLENVKHIQTIQDGEVYRTILDTFRKLGYAMKTVVMSPDQFGIPQNRKRVYFMGIRDITDFDMPPDPVSLPVEILQKDVAGFDVKYDVKKVIDAWDEALPVIKAAGSRDPVLIDEFHNTDDLSTYASWKKKYVQSNLALYAKNPGFWDAWVERHKDVLSKRAVYRKLEWQVGDIAEGDSTWNHFIQIRQSGIRVKKATFFPTLVAIVQTPIYGPEKRFLTPRECARLQSFPDDHVLHAKDQVAYKQLGNSVNVNVVDHIMRHLLKYL